MAPGPSPTTCIEIILAAGKSSRAKLIDMNLEERQYCRQIYHFLNIDKENKLGGKHAVLFKSLMSLFGEPT